MQAAVFLKHLRAGPQHQVKSVSQDDLAAHLLQFFRRHALDRAVGADGHEGRGVYRAPRKSQLSAPGLGVLRQEFKFHVCAKTTRPAPGRVNAGRCCGK